MKDNLTDENRLLNVIMVALRRKPAFNMVTYGSVYNETMRLKFVMGRTNPTNQTKTVSTLLPVLNKIFFFRYFNL